MTDFKNVSGYRYPFTTYHNHPFNKKELELEITVFKSWLVSLTYLQGKILSANLEDENKVLTELSELILKVKKLVSTLENGFEDFGIIKDAFSSLGKWGEYVNDVLEQILNCFSLDIDGTLYSLLDCVENRLFIIDDIISSIYDLVMNLAYQDYNLSYPTWGTDYDFTTYNGFYLDPSPANRTYVSINENVVPQKNGYLHIKTCNLSFGGYHPLLNDYQYGSYNDGICPLFSHGGDVEQSKILDINFLNDKFDSISGVSVNNCLFDMRPNDARATWNVDVGVYCLSNSIVTLNLRSIVDGFNQQYYFYVAQGFSSYLAFDSCGINVDFTYSFLSEN